MTKKILRQVFINNPPGKPGIAKRERQVQHGQKLKTCTYYVFNNLRLRKGERDEAKESRYRGIEIDLSVIRKMTTFYSGIMLLIEIFESIMVSDRNLGGISLTEDKFLELISHLLKEYESKGTIKIVVGNRTETKEVSHDEYLYFLNICNSFRQELKDSISNQISPADFFKKLKLFVTNKNEIQLNKQYINALKKYGYDISQGYTEYLNSEQNIPSLFNKNSFNDLSEGAKKKFVLHYFLVKEAELYGLKKSKWQPSRGFDGLIKALQKESGLWVAGNFSGKSYSQPPIKLNYQINDREVYGWPPKSYNLQGEGSHAILLLGVQEIENNGEVDRYVYYQDPMDESSPQQHAPLYIITYESFICRLQTIYGLQIENNLDPDIWPKVQRNDDQFAFFSPYKCKFDEKNMPKITGLVEDLPSRDDLERPANYHLNLSNCILC